MLDTTGSSRVVFVSNMGDDSISVVNIDKRKEIHRISLLPDGVKPGQISYTVRRPLVGPHSIKADRGKQNLYTVNSFDNSISILDIKEFIIKESFFAGCHPNDMVFNQDESCIYVTNGDSNSVSVIDIASKKVIGQIPVGSMPHGICESPDCEYIYVTNMDSDSITVIDTWSNSKVFSIKVGECPIDVITSRDGRYLYAACSYLGYDRSGVIPIISSNNFRVIKKIEVGLIPAQMVLSEDGSTLYVTNSGSSAVYIIDLNKFEVTDIIKAGNMTRGIAQDEEGYIYVTNSEDNTISIIDKYRKRVMTNIEVGVEPTSILYIGKSNL